MKEKNEGEVEDKIDGNCGKRFLFFHRGVFELLEHLSHLWIRFVRGSISFFPKRGSRGVSAPNCEMNIENHDEQPSVKVWSLLQ